jgi:putative membrane protein
VAGGVIGFMLVFRTSISYYRFYEGKKYLGHLHDSLRNANVAFCAFLRSGGTRRNADGTKRKESRDSRDGAKSKTCVETETAAAATATDETLNEDRIELRRLSNVLFAFVRQSLRERRHGYPLGCTLQATDDSLINDDVYGAPTLNALLTADEKNEVRIGAFTKSRTNDFPYKTDTFFYKHSSLKSTRPTVRTWWFGACRPSSSATGV